MDTTQTRTVLAAADVSAITQLVLTERESRDLGRWERLGACYLPDSHVEISWISGTGAQFVAGSVEMARRGVKARHRLGPVVVRLNAQRALASLGCVIDIPGELEGVAGFLPVQPCPLALSGGTPGWKLGPDGFLRNLRA